MDFGILDYIQLHLHSNLLDAVMPVITRLGDGGILWILCSLTLILFPRTRKTGAAMAAGLALEALCCNIILKPFVARIRPYNINTGVHLLISPPTDFSFPSGHTGASFAATSVLWFSRNRLWIPALVISLLIAFSRLYLYVHYPSDVLAGALLGIMLGWLGNAVVNVADSKLHS